MFKNSLLIVVVIVVLISAFTGCVDMTEFDAMSKISTKDSLYESLNAQNVSNFEAQLSTRSINNSNGRRIPVGTVMVYRTSAQDFGKLVIIKNDGTNNNGMTIKHITYQSDGTVKCQSSGFSIRGSYAYSLDAAVSTGVNMQTLDFSLHNTDSTTRDFLPMNGAAYKIVGIDTTIAN